MAKSTHYIDGKVLKGELHDFSHSYKLHAKEIYKNYIASEEFQQLIIDSKKSAIMEVLKDHVSLSKEDVASLKLKPTEGKKMSKGELVEKFVQKRKLSHDERIKLLKKNIYFKIGHKLASGQISEDLGEMFLAVAQNLANKKNWINYTYKDEMIGRGTLYLCQYAHNFNKHHPRANAFAYVTQICKNGFLQARETEDKQSVLKDRLIKRSMEKDELTRWNEEEYT